MEKIMSDEQLEAVAKWLRNYCVERGIDPESLQVVSVEERFRGGEESCKSETFQYKKVQ